MMEVDGIRCVGKIWWHDVKEDVKSFGVSGEDAQI